MIKRYLTLHGYVLCISRNGSDNETLAYCKKGDKYDKNIISKQKHNEISIKGKNQNERNLKISDCNKKSNLNIKSD